MVGVDEVDGEVGDEAVDSRECELSLTVSTSIPSAICNPGKGDGLALACLSLWKWGWSCGFAVRVFSSLLCHQLGPNRRDGVR